VYEYVLSVMRLIKKLSGPLKRGDLLVGFICKILLVLIIVDYVLIVGLGYLTFSRSCIYPRHFFILRSHVSFVFYKKALLVLFAAVAQFIGPWPEAWAPFSLDYYGTTAVHLTTIPREHHTIHAIKYKERHIFALLSLC